MPAEKPQPKTVLGSDLLVIAKAIKLPPTAEVLFAPAGDDESAVQAFSDNRVLHWDPDSKVRVIMEEHGLELGDPTEPHDALLNLRPLSLTASLANAALKNGGYLITNHSHAQILEEVGAGNLEMVGRQNYNIFSTPEGALERLGTDARFESPHTGIYVLRKIANLSLNGASSSG